MITGMMKAIKRIFLLLIACTVCNPLNLLADDIQDLLQRVAVTQNRKVKFSEERFAFYLEQPLRSRGELQFIKPDTLTKIVTYPVREVQKISAGRATLTRANGDTDSFELSNQPVIGTLINTIIAILAGDAATLKGYHEISLKKGATGWILLCTPRDEVVSDSIASIETMIENDRITSIKITETNGDYSLMILYDHEQH